MLMATDGELFPLNFINNALSVDTDLVMSVVIRTIMVSLFVLFAIRWMGHKGLGQLSMYELIILIGLGSAVGDPMFYEDVTLAQAFTAIVIVIALFKGFDFITARSRRFSRVTNPRPTLIVKDGQYIEDGLKKAQLNEDEYKSYMRLHGIGDVSEIELSYLEMNGQVSFIKKKKED
jgi:uncharacterized membrane protein YcaP (DUF421 family)